VVEILKAYQAVRTPSEWFFNVEGKQINREVSAAWYKALESAGITKGQVIFYDTRRTARTRMGQAGVSTSAAMAQLGHGAKMSARYDQGDYAVELRAKMGTKTPTQAVAIAPVAPVDVLKGKLETLKGLFDAGLIPQAVYEVKVAALL
jgi:hypothetical protein